MRFKAYMRRVIGQDAAIEAHQLVNQWNRNQHTPQFIYWLE